MHRILEIILGLEKGFLSKEGDLSLSFNPSWPGQEYIGAGIWNFLLIAGGIALKRSIVLSNHSAEEIKVKGVTLDVPEQSGFSYKSQCAETLAPEETCNIIVTWLPTSKGVRWCKLVG